MIISMEGMVSVKLAGIVVIGLVSALGILWRQYLIVNNKLSASEKEKTQLVIKQGDDLKELALAFLNEENIRGRIEDQLKAIYKRLDNLTKSIK